MQLTKLDPDERTFCRILVETGSTKKAANATGLDANKMLTQPLIALAVRDLLHARVLSAAPLALNVMQRLMTDPDVPAAVRRLAASDLLDRAGLVGPTAAKEARENLADMPAHALRDLVARLEGELFARSKPVRVLEVTADPANPLGFLD